MFKKFLEIINLNTKERTALYLLLAIALITIVVVRVVVRSGTDKEVTEIITEQEEAVTVDVEKLWNK